MDSFDMLQIEDYEIFEGYEILEDYIDEFLMTKAGREEVER